MDARRRRNLAVHESYVKTPMALQRTWLLEPVTIVGRPSPYEGPLEVHTYCDAYVETLAELEVVASYL